MKREEMLNVYKPYSCGVDKLNIYEQKASIATSAQSNVSPIKADLFAIRYASTIARSRERVVPMPQSEPRKTGYWSRSSCFSWIDGRKWWHIYAVALV